MVHPTSSKLTFYKPIKSRFEFFGRFFYNHDLIGNLTKGNLFSKWKIHHSRSFLKNGVCKEEAATDCMATFGTLVRKSQIFGKAGKLGGFFFLFWAIHLRDQNRRSNLKFFVMITSLLHGLDFWTSLAVGVNMCVLPRGLKPPCLIDWIFTTILRQWGRVLIVKLFSKEYRLGMVEKWPIQGWKLHTKFRTILGWTNFSKLSWHYVNYPLT